MANPLSATAATGTQMTTQSPQVSTNSGPATVASGNVQPGTSTSLLSAQNGVLLRPTPLSTVSFSPSAATSQTQAIVAPSSSHHHVSGAFIGFAAALFIVALVLFISVFKSAKNTTK